MGFSPSPGCDLLAEQAGFIQRCLPAYATRFCIRRTASHKLMRTTTGFPPTEVIENLVATLQLRPSAVALFSGSRVIFPPTSSFAPVEEKLHNLWYRGP